MLYPTPIEDDFKKDENISDDEENILNIKKVIKTKNKGELNKKKNKNVINSELLVDNTIGEISANFHFEIDDIEDNNKSNNDLEGLTTFLKKNQNCASTLEEKIVLERKRIKNKINFNSEMSEIDKNILNEEIEEIATPFSIELLDKTINNDDRLRLKQLGNKEISNSEEINQNILQTTTPSSFDELNLSRPILKAILEFGFQLPTPIQAACIPVALAGRDLCACSATGTGKTAAFMLPIFERLLYKPQGKRPTTRVLVLVPTRELAIQVFQVSKRLAKYTSVEMCLVAGWLFFN